jgi:CheY-like chemotaxis protein
LAQQRGLSFEVKVAASAPQGLRGDPSRVCQVLMNLLGNAIKFTDSGTVTLGAWAEPKGPAQVLLRLDVEDTGVGIRPDDLQRIFQPFEQVGDAENHGGGSGLGLAITRALVNDMGGQVEVSSELGRGTRFRVELPLLVAQPTQPAQGASRQGSGVARYEGPPRRVLVVDDVAANRALMCDFLTSAGFEVTQANDGTRMLVTAKSFRPDLILMDGMSMDGVEATRRLRGDADLAAVPVIAVSASATAEHRAACLQAGVNVFLTKPVSLETLQAHIGNELRLQWIQPTEGAM